MRHPDPLHRGGRDADVRGHRAHRPVGRLARRRRQRAGDHPLDQIGRQPGDARGPGLVAQQPVDTGLQVARLPAPHAGLGLARPAHDRDRADAVGREQHDLRPPDVFLRAVPVGHDRRQARTIGGRKPKAAGFSHARTLAQAAAKQDSYVRDDPLAIATGGRIASARAYVLRRAVACVEHCAFACTTQPSSRSALASTRPTEMDAAFETAGGKGAPAPWV